MDIIPILLFLVPTLLPQCHGVATTPSLAKSHNEVSSSFSDREFELVLSCKSCHIISAHRTIVQWFPGWVDTCEAWKCEICHAHETNSKAKRDSK